MLMALRRMRKAQMLVTLFSRGCLNDNSIMLRSRSTKIATIMKFKVQRGDRRVSTLPECSAGPTNGRGLKTIFNGPPPPHSSLSSQCFHTLLAPHRPSVENPLLDEDSG